MSIKSEVDELNDINIEIKRQVEILKKLREKKKTLETSIADYLNQKEIPGVKYNGDVILIERKNRVVNKSKKVREAGLLKLLKENGVQNVEEVAEKIKTMGKDKITMERIKINKAVE